MPFLTDGINSKFIDEIEYVGKYLNGRYVIARKLYVCVEPQLPAGNYLQSRFEKYGQIESTEVLKSGKEGYVTFSYDLDACLAYHREKDYGVDVAYPWHQPSTVTEPQSEDEHDAVIDGGSPLLLLNDDCFYGLFNYLDNETLVHLSETCTQLYRLLAYTYTFPNREFKLDGGTSTGTPMPLAMVRNIFRLMGSYFQVMDIDVTCMRDTDVLSYLQTMLKYCEHNTRMRTMKFAAMAWKVEFDALILAFAGSLERLDLCSLNGHFCPDVITICPKLKALTTHHVYNFATTTDRPGLPTFPVKNLQIRKFKTSLTDAIYFQTLALRLPNVEKLSLILFQVTLDDFRHLTNLKLIKLKLKFDLVRGTFANLLCGMFEILQGVGSLMELKLYLTPTALPMEPDEIDRLVMHLAAKLPHLKRVDLVGFTGINESTVLNFIWQSKNLGSFHLHRSPNFRTESFIVQLVSDRKCLPPRKLNLYLDADEDGAVVDLNSIDMDPYLTIQYKCSHNEPLKFQSKHFQ
ncbi:uncharacterized protein LOC119085125 [Bradysia coprophila]|uniref:uncharacterized protein LOC119085125 n=1 Tax=Bradysia coprophila TaxID=38358 RepID=UPI00187D9991|nr:uncharacterized protein LOC119085125 [Bradysia coprophila]